MQNVRALLLSSLSLTLLGVAACGVDGAADAGRGPPGVLGCVRDADCPAGLACVELECVAIDEKPPETPDPRTFLPPLASPNFVYALSPDGSTVAVIDPFRLEVGSISLPPEPVSLAVIPDRDEVLILSRAGAALSLLSLEADAPRIAIQGLGRRLSTLALSPDARWALLWTREGEPLDAGAEGLVLLVDVMRLRSGDPAHAIERVAGRRHTDVFFRTEEEGGAAVAKDAVMVGKEELAIFDLEDPGASAIPARLPLPAPFAEIGTRRVVASPDGAFVLLASLASTELLVLDTGARTLGSLPVGAPVSDLAISPDGAIAVAVLRSEGRVSWFSPQEAIADPGVLRTAPVSLPGARCESPGCTVSPGQVRLAPGGAFALLFTNANPTESFGRLDLETGDWEVFDRIQKEVQTIAIAPSGGHALVLHRRQLDSTVADPYEREVDHAEGYSVVDLGSGLAQLVLTGDARPLHAIFQEPYAAVSLRGDESRVFRVDAIDLETLVAAPLSLPSAPEHAGPLTGSNATGIWITQVHAAGRISFIDLAPLHAHHLGLRAQRGDRMRPIQEEMRRSPLALLVLCLSLTACGERAESWDDLGWLEGPIVAGDALAWMNPGMNLVIRVRPGAAPSCHPILENGRSLAAAEGFLLLLADEGQRTYLQRIPLAGGGASRIPLQAAFSRLVVAEGGRSAVAFHDLEAAQRPGGPAARNLNEVSLIDLEVGRATRLLLPTGAAAPVEVLFSRDGELAAILFERAVALVDVRSPTDAVTVPLKLPGGQVLQIRESILDPEGELLFLRTRELDEVLAISIEREGEALGASINFLGPGGGDELQAIALPRGEGLARAVVALYQGSATLFDADGDGSRERSISFSGSPSRIAALGEGLLVFHGEPSQRGESTAVVAWDLVSGRVAQDRLEGPLAGPPRLVVETLFFPHTVDGHPALSAARLEREDLRLRLRIQPIGLAGSIASATADEGVGSFFAGLRIPRERSGAASRPGGEGQLTGALLSLRADDLSIESLPLDEVIVELGAVGDHLYALHPAELGDVTFVPKARLTRGAATRSENLLVTGLMGCER